MFILDGTSLIGRTAVDPAGRTIGPISEVYPNEQTGRPEWISVTIGLFGPRQNFAPLSGATIRGDEVVLPVAAEVVKNSPNSAVAEHLGKDEQKALVAYYRPFLRRHPAPTMPAGRSLPSPEPE